MKRGDNIRSDEKSRNNYVFEAYPVKNKRKKSNIEQHFIVPWEMTLEKKKSKKIIKSSEQVVYFY